MTDALDRVGEDFHRLLHKLWSKAGTDYYVKADWIALEACGYKLMKAAQVAPPFGLPSPGDRIE